jgi:hypothetical protein
LADYLYRWETTVIWQTIEAAKYKTSVSSGGHSSSFLVPAASTNGMVRRRGTCNVAKDFSDVFSEEDVSKCFYLMDDFHSSGRISGNQRIPLAKLESGRKFIVDRQRLEVKPSVGRYKLEVANLTAVL